MGVRERCSGRGLGGRHKGRVNGAHQRGTGELAIEVIDLLVCVGELHCECRIQYVEMFFFSPTLAGYHLYGGAVHHGLFVWVILSSYYQSTATVVANLVGWQRDLPFVAVSLGSPLLESSQCGVWCAVCDRTGSSLSCIPFHRVRRSVRK